MLNNPLNRVCEVLEVLAVHLLDPNVLDGLHLLRRGSDGAVPLEPPLHVGPAGFYGVEVWRVARPIHNNELILEPGRAFFANDVE